VRQHAFAVLQGWSEHAYMRGCWTHHFRVIEVDPVLELHSAGAIIQHQCQVGGLLMHADQPANQRDLHAITQTSGVSPVLHSNQAGTTCTKFRRSRGAHIVKVDAIHSKLIVRGVGCALRGINMQS
jgi:hypothetical protein